LLTQGGPMGSTNVVVWSIYKDAFLNSRFGNACATSVVLALICLVLTVISLTTVGRSTTE
jgi:sn-glycerol 3-phosphate transport system permease protein